MVKLEKVYLNPDRDYVFCFSKEKIILEEDCDYYEHNIECDKKDDVFGRTHHKGSLAGYTYSDTAGSILNECDYCLKKDRAKEYMLSVEASKVFQKKASKVFQKNKNKQKNENNGLLGWLRR